MKPKRVRVNWRHEGGKKPPGVVYVGRPSVFGNPWSVTEVIASGLIRPECAAEVAVSEYRGWLLKGMTSYHPRYVELRPRLKKLLAALPTLRGKSLACWCPLPADGEPDVCHAAVLLDLVESLP